MKRALCIFAVALASLAALLLAISGAKAAYRQYLFKKYPVAYVEEIQKSAAAYRLNPYLVLAVVRSESSFRPDARSYAGAIGLMQIMPETGAWIAEEQGLSGEYDESQLTDPATNIAFGCWYLRYLADLFDGDFQKMVCAYNAGQGSVQKWLDNPAYANNDVLTTIPFPATAAYYENVLTAYTQYQALYPALFTEGGKVAAISRECYNTVTEDLPC